MLDIYFILFFYFKGGYFYEYYKTEEDLLFLLNNTPIIPEFGKIQGDYEKFREYVEKNNTEKGIILTRRLFGIKLIK